MIEPFVSFEREKVNTQNELSHNERFQPNALIQLQGLKYGKIVPYDLDDGQVLIYFGRLPELPFNYINEAKFKVLPPIQFILRIEIELHQTNI